MRKTAKRALLLPLVGLALASGCSSSSNTQSGSDAGHGASTTTASSKGSGSTATSKSVSASLSGSMTASSASSRVPDASTDVESMLECSGGCTNGLGCAPGCSVVTHCTTGGNECSCDCSDAGVVTSTCEPDRDAGCPMYYIPATCFDAAIPASPTQSQCAALCGATNVAACGPTLPGGRAGLLCATCLQG